MPKGVYPHTHIKPKVYPVEMVERVKMLYHGKGMSQIEVASELGVSLKVIYRLMKNHNIKRRPRVKRHQLGPLNDAWKGDDVGYSALHYRVSAIRGVPQHCVLCGEDNSASGYEWANMTGNYYDIEDYARLCRLCHRRYDTAVRSMLKGVEDKDRRAPCRR